MSDNLEYQRIKDLVLSPYIFYGGDWQLNFVWERTSYIYTNMMTDWLHILYSVKDKDYICTVPASTKAGLYGKHAVLDPITVS